MRISLLAVSFLAFAALADAPTPASVANLVHQNDAVALSTALTETLQSATPLVRATAARVVAVRGQSSLLGPVRDALATETDAVAAREQIRALALVGNEEDIAVAVKAAERWPQSMSNALAAAVARRGGTGAIDVYGTHLRATRMTNHVEFFGIALWGRPALVPLAGSRMLASGDEKAWRGLLGALADSDMALNGGVMASSLGAPSEDIRSASLWFLVRGYSPDPSALSELVKSALAVPRTDLSSDREDFGRELLRRMLGGERNGDGRWLKFLDSEEADELLQGRDHALQYLTDDEYRVRYTRCEVQTQTCAMPEKRSRRTIPSQPVAPPAFYLPEMLPAGLADAILREGKCRGTWLGIARASVDEAGRTKELDLGKVSGSDACKRAMETVVRLSLATNTSLRSEFTSPILLVGSAKRGLCLDEDSPETATPTYRSEGEITPPQVLKRVEPDFPESARQAMAGGKNVLVIVESVVSKTGCVRGIRLLSQSPFGEVNGAALLALSQWTFRPGYFNKVPVDVIFNLTVNFTTR
jgi:hypothetical protein